jgi:hypothetical protein
MNLKDSACLDLILQPMDLQDGRSGRRRRRLATFSFSATDQQVQVAARQAYQMRKLYLRIW